MIPAEEVTEYLYTNIPISRALGVKVESIEERTLTLSAVFSKNINHKKTVFGGSLQSIATLSCWSWLYTRLRSSRPEIVIVESSMQFPRPTTGDFFARAVAPETEIWERFVRVYEKKGKGKIALHAEIGDQSGITAHFSGVFAALSRNSHKSRVG